MARHGTGLLICTDLVLRVPVAFTGTTRVIFHNGWDLFALLLLLITLSREFRVPVYTLKVCFLSLGFEIRWSGWGVFGLGYLLHGMHATALILNLFWTGDSEIDIKHFILHNLP
jgi:hypothetical protein